MTMNTQQPGVTESTSIPIGAKLQSAREAQRLDRKDAAAKLRLNEYVIDMIENNSFPATMPPIFVRGYIRAYGKLLEVSEDVISAGLEPIKPQAPTQDTTNTQAPAMIESSLKRRQYLMKGATSAIALTLLSLVVVWWHNHAKAPQAENIALAVPTESAPIIDAAPQPAGLTIHPPQARVALQNNNALPADASTLHANTSIAIAPGRLAAITPAHTEAAVAKPADDASIPAYKRAALAAATKKTVTEENTEVE